MTRLEAAFLTIFAEKGAGLSHLHHNRTMLPDEPDVERRALERLPVRNPLDAGRPRSSPRRSSAGSLSSPAHLRVDFKERSDTVPDVNESMESGLNDDDESETGWAANSSGGGPASERKVDDDLTMGSSEDDDEPHAESGAGSNGKHPTAMSKEHALAVSGCILHWARGCHFAPLNDAPWPIPDKISDVLRHDVPRKFMWRHYIEIDPLMFECLQLMTKLLINASNEATDARQEAHDWVMRHLEFHFTDEYGMLIYAEICMAEELSVMAEKVGKHVLLAMHSALYALIVAFEWFNVDYTAVRTFASSIDEGKGATAQFYDQSTPVKTATPASSAMQAAHAMLAELDKLDLAAATPIVRLTPLSGALEGTTLSDTLEVRRSTRIHTVLMNRRLLSS